MIKMNSTAESVAFVLSDNILCGASVFAAILFLHIGDVDMTDYVIVYGYVLTN